MCKSRVFGGVLSLSFVRAGLLGFVVDWWILDLQGFDTCILLTSLWVHDLVHLQTWCVGFRGRRFVIACF